MFPTICAKLVRVFLIDSDHNIDSEQSEELNAAHQMKDAILKTYHIIDSDQSEELNAVHQMKYAILKTCVIKEIQSKTLKQISQITAGH